MERPTPIPRATASFRSVDCAEERVQIELFDDSVIRFGRGSDCDIRFGHAPTRDDEVPRHAGTLMVANGRVIVESPGHLDLSIGDGIGIRRGLVIRSASMPEVAIESGSVIGPPEQVFTVVVSGRHQDWEINIAVRQSEDASGLLDDEEPPTSFALNLTPEQLELLWAYATPILAGAMEPATHDQVAAQIHMSRAVTRRRLEALRDLFFAAGLWLPETRDSRVQVVESARKYGLLRHHHEAP